VNGVRYARIFWIGAAGALVLAAFVAIGAIARGDFGETDARILGTLFTLLLACGTTVSGLALVERRQLVVFGRIAVVLAVASLLVIAAAIWSDPDDEFESWALRALVLLFALLLRTSGPTWVFGATAACAAIATLTTWAALSGDGDAWEIPAIFWVLTVLGYLLLPVLQRFGAPEVSGSAAPSIPEHHDDPAERVLDALDGVELVVTRSRDGSIETYLAPGERLLLRRRVPRS
jgi:hypothetical protein